MVSSIKDMLRSKILTTTLIMLFVFSFSKSWGQAVIPVSRTSWGGAEPTGWTNSGCTQRASSFACSGSNGTIFDDNGDFRIVFYNSSASQLIFKLKSSSMSGASSLLVQESVDGATWSNIGNYGTAGGATAITDCGNITLNLNCASRYIKWSYTKGSGNCDMDDVSITQGTCTVCTPPSTTLTPTSQTICAGSVISFTVADDVVTPSPSYTWQASVNGTTGWSTVANATPVGATYSGINTNSLSITGGSTYFYRCLVTDNTSSCTATSSTGSLVVIAAPSITLQPTNVATTSGGSASYTVGVSGTGLSYQWQQNTGSGFSNISNGGTNPTYAGATSSVLAISNIPLSMSGYSYQCVVTNTCGLATSNTATLAVVAGACVNEGFNAGTTVPSGWTFTNIGGTYTSAGNFGNSSPSLQMDATNDRVTTIALSGNVATELSFWIKGQGSTGSSLLVEGFDGVSWSTIENITPLPTTGTIKTYNSGTTPALANNLIQFRFTYNRSAGNLSFDDVSIYCAPACVGPTVTLSPASQTICAGTVASFSVADNASSPSYTWQASANGTSGWATVVNATPVGATYTGINTNSLSISGGSTYYYRCLVTETGSCTAISSTGTLIVTSAPTITLQPSSVSTTSTSSVNFTVGASGAGLSYQWKENSGSGFVNISNGGSNPTYAGATNSVLTISNPPMSMSGYSYQCIVSNACGTATTNGVATLTVTTALTCPYLVAAVINACAGSCGGEGNNEFVVMNSGSYSIPVNGTDLNLYYSGGTNHNFTDSYAAQPSVISDLNNLAGCGTLFVDVSNGTIPPNSTFFIMNQGSCFNTGSFSAYCGLGTIYVAFSSDPDWPAAGYFGNNSTPRYFQTNFSTIDAGCATVTYSYNNSSSYDFGSATAGDGASVVFNGTTPSYVDGGGDCVPPVAILPIELLDFYGTQNGDKNDLIWKVAVEDNINAYIIEKSNDGVVFEELTRVIPKGTSQGYANYLTEDLSPNNGITYYRLNTIESEGEIIQNKIIDVDRSSKEWKPLIYQMHHNLIVEFKNTLPKNSTISLYDLSGKLLVDESIKEVETKIEISNYATGLYFVKIATPYKTENFKIVIQK
jgi:hypothetical protein